MLTCLSFEVVDEIESAESLQFTFTTIRDATEDFSEKNMLGQDDIEHLISHAWRNWREGTAQDIIDPVLSSGSTTEMMRCITSGYYVFKKMQLTGRQWLQWLLC
ncbi:hypothetical protein OIU76_026051 [Salix suchowensis]|nr:hypothetical protein OIU76_026051 [Salix suchowensis]